jgi:hypothetical protein
MLRLTLDVEAGRIPAELARRGISARTKVHGLIKVDEPDGLPMAALAEAGGAFDFLNDEPETYSDDDIIERNG